MNRRVMPEWGTGGSNYSLPAKNGDNLNKISRLHLVSLITCFLTIPAGPGLLYF
jgi:hypothetical protein